MEYEQKLGVEVFVDPIYDVILYHYLLSLVSFNNTIFSISNYFIWFYR